jgi:hypothetical protein
MRDDFTAQLPYECLTADEIVALEGLRQDKHDAERDAREILLAARAREPGEVKEYKNWPEAIKGTVERMSRREREGFSVLTKPEFIQWSETQERVYEAIESGHKTVKSIISRLRETWGDEA